MVQQYTRAVGVAARLLFVVVLALGVFLMHTVGHPGEGSGTTASSHAGATGAVGGLHGHGHGHQADAVTDASGSGSASAPTNLTATNLTAANLTAGPVPTSGVAPADEPGTAMDMGSLCLAVLGSWALAALLHAVFVGRRDWFARIVAGLLAVVRANPPPRAPDLAQLSILRI